MLAVLIVTGTLCHIDKTSEVCVSTVHPNMMSCMEALYPEAVEVVPDMASVVGYRQTVKISRSKSMKVICEVK